MIRFILTASLLAGAVTPALAQETQQSAAAKFKTEFAERDTNHDGVLTRAEVAASIERMKAGPGRTFDTTHAKRLADLWFTAADKDRNGKVSEKEAQALLAATFKKYDANGDGVIGADERANAKNSIEGAGR